MIIILGLIAGYREVQTLCDRGSWNYLDFRNWFWFTNQAEKKESWRDSFHVSGGLFALVLCIGLATCTNWMTNWISKVIPLDFLGDFKVIAYILILWVLYFYARNLMMHVILPLKPDLRYLIPLVGTYFKK